MSGQQTVVDAAAGGRFDEAGGVADRENAIGPGARTGASGRARGAGPARDRGGHARREATPRNVWNLALGVAFAEQADARERRPAPFERHDPRESARRDLAAEMHLHVIDVGNGTSSWALCTSTLGTPKPSARLNR